MRLGPAGAAALAREMDRVKKENIAPTYDNLLNVLLTTFLDHGLSEADAIEFIEAFDMWDDLSLDSGRSGPPAPAMSAAELRRQRSQRKKELERKKRKKSRR